MKSGNIKVEGWQVRRATIEAMKLLPTQDALRVYAFARKLVKGKDK